MLNNKIVLQCDNCLKFFDSGDFCILNDEGFICQNCSLSEKFINLFQSFIDGKNIKDITFNELGILSKHSIELSPQSNISKEFGKLFNEVILLDLQSNTFKEFGKLSSDLILL